MEAAQNTTLRKSKKRVLGPGVYVLKRKDQPLYVGSTKDLSKRPRHGNKNQANRLAARAQADETQLIPCKSIADAQRLEQHLIITCKPIFNRRNASAPSNLEQAFHIARNLRK